MNATTTAPTRPTAVSDYFQPPPENDPSPDSETQEENNQGDPRTDGDTPPGQDPGRQPPQGANAEAEPGQTSQGDPALDRAAVERLYRRGLINLQSAKRAAAIIKGAAPAFRNNTPPGQAPNPHGTKPSPRPSRRTPVLPDDYEDTHPLSETPGRVPAREMAGPETTREQQPPHGSANVPRQGTRADDSADQTPPQDEGILSHWAALTKSLSRSKGEKFNIGALLRDCPTHHLIWDGELLTAQFKSRDNLNRFKDELADPRMVDLVQTAFRAEFGENAQITFNGPPD